MTLLEKIAACEVEYAEATKHRNEAEVELAACVEAEQEAEDRILLLGYRRERLAQELWEEAVLERKYD